MLDSESIEQLERLQAEEEYNQYISLNEEDAMDENIELSEDEDEDEDDNEDEDEPENPVANESDTQLVQPTQGTRKKRKRRKTSHVWLGFKSVGLGADGKERGKCIYCGAELVIGSNHGTNHLRRHLLGCLKNPNKKKVRPVYSHKLDRDMMSEVIIYHDLPFRYCEYKKVRERDLYLNPDCKPICRQTAALDVFRKYKMEKLKLKEVLRNHRGRICLTSDLWTAKPTVMGYMCLTAHFIDEDWILNSKILGFCDLKTPHTGESIANSVLDCLKEWDIVRKVFSVTLDNAANNGSMLSILKGKLQMISGSGLLCDGKFIHVRCCAHVLNLIVLDPRMKIQMLEVAYERVDSTTSKSKVEELKRNMTALYEDYQMRSSIVVSVTPTPQELVTESPLDDFDNDLMELEQSIDVGLANTKSHLDIYLSDRRLERRMFPNLDVLEFWKENGHRYGELASMARDLLSIPITTVASESAFSVGSRVLTPYRNRLLLKTVQALLCTRNWLRGFPDFEGTIEDGNEETKKTASSTSGVESSKSGESCV